MVFKVLDKAFRCSAPPETRWCGHEWHRCSLATGPRSCVPLVSLPVTCGGASELFPYPPPRPAASLPCPAPDGQARVSSPVPLLVNLRGRCTVLQCYSSAPLHATLQSLSKDVTRNATHSCLHGEVIPRCRKLLANTANRAWDDASARRDELAPRSCVDGCHDEA
jgi:hypothetical protein